MRIRNVLASVLLVAVSNVFAEDNLSEQEIKNLFSNQTFDGINVSKNIKFKGYDSEDGTHLIYLPHKDKTFKRKWWTDGDKHCTSHPKRGDSCKSIVNKGDGVYYGYINGKHTHTLSNFQRGKHL